MGGKFTLISLLSSPQNDTASDFVVPEKAQRVLGSSLGLLE